MYRSISIAWQTHINRNLFCSGAQWIIVFHTIIMLYSEKVPRDKSLFMEQYFSLKYSLHTNIQFFIREKRFLFLITNNNWQAYTTSKSTRKIFHLIPSLLRTTKTHLNDSFLHNGGALSTTEREREREKG